MQNKHFIKSTLLYLLMGTSLTACNSGQGSSGTTLTTKQPNNLTASLSNFPVYIGAPAVTTVDGVMVLKDAEPCVTLANPETIKAHYTAAGNGSSLKLDKNLTTEEILEKLGVVGGLKGAIGSVSGDFQADYENAHTSSQLEYRVTLHGSQEGRFSLESNVLNKSSSGGLEQCGDGFVAGGLGGIYYEGSVIIKFNSLKDKQALIADGTLKVDDLGELAAKLSKDDTKAKSSYTVKLELAQKGGNSERIFRTFTDDYNLNNEIPSGRFYLATLNADNMEAAVTSMQRYIEEELTPQAESLRKITTLKEVNDLVYFQTPSKASYANDTQTWNRSSDLRDAVAASNAIYNMMQDYKKSYTNFFSLVSDYKGRDDAIAVVKVSDENMMNLKIWHNSMLDIAKGCFGYVGSKTDIANCIKDLNKQSESALDMMKKIDLTKWEYGYKLSDRSNTREGLVPIAVDKAGVVTRFVTASNNIPSSFYYPGTEYTYDKVSKTISATDPAFALDTESFILSNRIIKYKDVQPVHIGEASIKTGGVEYSDALDAWEKYKAANYPGLATEILVTKLGRRAATSPEYADLLKQ